MPELPASDAAERFYAEALQRIRKFLLALTAAGVLIAAFAFPWRVFLGFCVGSAISYVNHRWLERMVDAMGERIVTGRSSERGGLFAARALLRYVSIAVAAYVIFRVSRGGLFGFLAGICLPIAAIACEAAVEIVAALRHEF